MKPADFPAPVKHLISELRRLPGVGPRGAERMAIWLLQDSRADPTAISEALLNAESQVKACDTCGFFTTESQCDVCTDEGRNRSLLCVVEQATDVLRLERSRGYDGLYHCLGGKLSPLDGVGPEDLGIASLMERIRGGEVEEIILALGSDVEGEATANYLREELRSSPVKVSRIAQGLPAGGGLDHADELTLLRALTDRRRLG